VVLLRALGSEPSKLEVKRFLADVDGANTGQLDFDGYLQIVLDNLAEKPTADEVAKAFRLFSEGDNESRRISFERLKQIGEQIGEQISDEELREMISEADTSGTGLIGNDDFSRIITSRHRTA
jgi:Ca2+-binding EF-hand superfamily protein